MSLMAAPSFANTNNINAQMKASAVIEKSCMTSASDLVFGEYAPSASKLGESQIDFQCSKGVVVEVNIERGDAICNWPSSLEFLSNEPASNS